MGIADVLFHQHFVWQFQKHTTLWVKPIDGHTHDHDHGFGHCHVDILSAFSVKIPKTYNTWGQNSFFILFWKKHNLKQESHLNLQCWRGVYKGEIFLFISGWIGAFGACLAIFHLSKTCRMAEFSTKSTHLIFETFPYLCTWETAVNVWNPFRS